MEPTLIFTGAFKVTLLDDKATYRLDIWKKPGQIGHTAPDVTRTVRNGDPFDFTDYNGANELTVTFRAFQS